MAFWRKGMLFCLGGSAYFILEMLWRGRSYGSMFLLGGVCFLLVGALSPRLRRVPLALRLLPAAGLITALELLTGLLVNRDYTVWDYRQLPFNFLGQICLPFSLLWIPVSLAAMLLYTWAEKRLPR